MTELENIQRAKMYIDKLANGIDPLTDLTMTDDTILNNVRLSRCFFYVSDILRQVVANGGVISKSTSNTTVGRHGEPFHITQDEARNFTVSNEAMSISNFCEMVSDAFCREGMKKLSYRPILEWLTEREYLTIVVKTGRKRTAAGKNAEQIGIYEETRRGAHGEYSAVLYNPTAQKFIMDNLVSILNDVE